VPDGEPIPEDFPGYKHLIDHGLTTLDEVRNMATVGDLTEIKGIGPATAADIEEALNA
jgi:DNA polymerase/3'-5' exonuclease PolX